MLDFRQGGTVSRVGWTRRQRASLAVGVILAGLLLGLLSTGSCSSIRLLLGVHRTRPADGDKIDTRAPRALAAADEPGAFHSPAEKTPPEPGGPPSSGRYFPGVRPEELRSVRDDTYFRPEEHDAWFHLLGVLRQADEPSLVKASTGTATFVQLFRQSDEYRGELVTLRGTLRQCSHCKAPKNGQGIAGYYQTWITPIDHPSYVIVAYCLELPGRFPQGDGLEEEVELTGFFYKRWLYNARSGLHTAPVVLARTLHVLKRASAIVAAPQHSPWVVAVSVIGAAVLGIAFALVLLARAGSRAAGPEIHRGVLMDQDSQPLPPPPS